MEQSFKNKVIFISGGTGSWGQELTQQLLASSPSKIIIYSRWEHKQVDMKRKFHEHKNIHYVIWDVRDKERLLSITKWVDIIFHLAALKHVPVCEENPNESVLTNILGTQNIIDVALANNVERVIDVSTDKAVDPFNIYGTCKAVWEKLIIAANMQSKSTTFVCIRGGNVLGTNGSVVPLFIEQIKKADLVTITDPDMTRYIMRLAEAVWLLITASVHAKWGEVFVMKMPWITVQTIADSLIQVFGSENTKQKIVGSRPGEKKHELLVSQYESERCHILNESYFVILPMIDTGKDYTEYTKLPKIEQSFFASNNTNMLSAQEFVETLRKDWWFNHIEQTKTAIQELEQLSKDEIIKYFLHQQWAK